MRLKFLGLLPLAALLFASCSDENGLDSGATGKLNISLKPDYSLTSSVGEERLRKSTWQMLQSTS